MDGVLERKGPLPMTSYIRIPTPYCVREKHSACVICEPLMFSLGCHDQEVRLRAASKDGPWLKAAIDAREQKRQSMGIFR